MLSEVPKPKRRRVNTSPLSDEDVEAEDGEQDEDQDMEAKTSATENLKPLATSTISKGQKAVPVPVLSGARTNARSGKKRATGTTAPTVNKAMNGTQSSHVPKIKQEDDMDERESVSETATTATVAEETAAMSIDVSYRDKECNQVDYTDLPDVSLLVATKRESGRGGTRPRLHYVRPSAERRQGAFLYNSYRSQEPLPAAVAEDASRVHFAPGYGSQFSRFGNRQAWL